MIRRLEGSHSPTRQTDGAERQVSRGRVLVLASVLAIAPMITGFPQVSAQAKAHPVKSQVREVGFVKSSVPSMRAARGATRSAQSAPGKPDPIATAAAGAVAPVQNAKAGVTVVGVTWPKGAVSAGDQFQIRTLTGTTWSQWESFDSDQADGPDAKEAAAAATGGTSPYVVTGASKYEVRSLTTDSTTPSAATVQVVDPGDSGADAVQQAPGAAAAATAKPTIYTRAQWGADESLRKAAPSYGQVRLGFVHHTDSSNTYAASQVPAMIRGIYAYHVKGQHWSDIGYNFLVDRFGRTWEGRYGGMDRAVVGAQTLNYNSYSTGISAIGNYEATAVPAAMTYALKRVIAWKFSVTGTPATGLAYARGKYFQRISGHRDGFATSCPGASLYARLPAIRAGAAALIGAPAPAPAPGPAPPPAQAPARATPSTTRYTPYYRVVLRQGARGSGVVVLQRGLRISADGVFGPRTRAAVLAFQTRTGLVRTGAAGRGVWAVLERREYPLIAYRKLTVQRGNRGRAVKVVQRALRLPADGVYGLRTANRVKIVQGRNRLARTGWVRGWTWVAVEKQMRR